jgi:alpha-L-fucosidase
LPPDRRGRIHENDARALREFRRIVDATFAKNLAARVSADNWRGGDRRFAPANVLDGRRDTYWTTDDNVKTPSLVIDLGQPSSFNVVRVREYLPLGQRIEAIAVDTWQNGSWVELAQATSIGNCRLIRTPQPVTTKQVRLRVTQAPVCPAVSEVGVFAEPA